MRAADLLTVLSNPPTKKPYESIELTADSRSYHLTGVEITETGQCNFLFTQGQKQLPMKELLVFLMKNREKEIFYQKDKEKLPLYGIKEKDQQLII
ncbi:hypothetical protein [Enterococcus durans]|uniref:Uncharacterized protein n=2 Tax=Enterococcus durans TaxID=53345 RepID=A0A377L442_9ENTE|nr:hypothetical protein [Enterococcus durans]HCB28935.1 hypothetical protein [Enterococcus sp.]EOT34905.1 hypothetical protein OMS_00789 [Enterococcus durans ATCC 6056]EOU19538.1 hypothetical protein I571_02542 [Enterococcus durans ATCC 6056]MDB1686123.1 hypothetical protein [Enterococcus durans]PEH44445.1 hypothetical protein CRM96_05250 [Enterococcus durans]